jgi:large subunit ribosomal protein L23
MATKKTTKKADVSPETKPVSASVIIGPHITEKAAYAAEKNVYVFDVTTDANKIQIAQAIKAQYKVTPTKVAIVVSKPKSVTFRGKAGKQSGSKKAYVYLKKGDTIEIA